MLWVSDKDLEKVLSPELPMWVTEKLLVTMTGSRRGRADLDKVIKAKEQ